MPVDRSLKKILVIGSGPIVIGQAAEFDYAGTQAVHALKEEGIEVVLINSNPATIMTDKETADKVYLEPLTKEFLLKIIFHERPDGILPTLGGQTALNLALELDRKRILEREGIQLLGCNSETIKKAEDRLLFKELMNEIGEPVIASEVANDMDQAQSVVERIGLPVIIRPAYTLGGSGGGHAFDEKEFKQYATSGLQQSPINQVLIEKNISGYKEIEYEIMRDGKDNCIVICNMENIDPVGIHTGDSIVVAPSQTLSDKEYQMLRSSSLKIIRALDIKGGCNVQLALDPHSYEYFVIEVNPRVSRSSALASKATGYPIAKIAAKIAIGMSLDEIINPVTQKTYACFEPALDYVVTKIPRWPFDKFTTANRELSSQMKATGEVMAIGRNIESSLLKAVRSLEIDEHSLFSPELEAMSTEEVLKEIAQKNDRRLFAVATAMRKGVGIEKLHQLTRIDQFFLYKIKNIVDLERTVRQTGLTNELVSQTKRYGFSNVMLSELSERSLEEVEAFCDTHQIYPVFKMVDTCAGEFESATPYYYSCYEDEDEVLESTKEKILILGSGPIRIGQGIEFDYATVHAVMTIKEMGYQAIIINNNPETVSTDFNISDRLYFEPLTVEDVMHVIHKENPIGVIVQFGGQTAINLAEPLSKRGVKILGTSIKDIDHAEDRKKFEKLLSDAGIEQPQGITVTSHAEALESADDIGFPMMVRPSYVLGGRAMEIVYDKTELDRYMREAVKVNPHHPVLMDKYLIGLEAEVDAISDGHHVIIPGIMEHIEKAGVHSGDSMAVYPPQTISKDIQQELVRISTDLCQRLSVIGILNLQFIIRKNKVYVIEVNPRSSRTVPFLSKVTKVPITKIATKAVMGQSLIDQDLELGLCPEQEGIYIKAPVFSFAKLKDVDIALGPEMKSTGEVMGHEMTMEKALYKTMLASGIKVPYYGSILVTIADKDKDEAIELMKRFYQVGFKFVATSGTARALQAANLPAEVVAKIGESDFDLIDEIKSGKVQLVINTLSKGKDVASDGFQMRRTATENGIICLTSLDTAKALISSMEINSFRVSSL